MSTLNFLVKEDFKYAARLYLESIVACTNGLTTKLFPDNVIDDLVGHLNSQLINRNF